jgi:hypothetical protein
VPSSASSGRTLSRPCMSISRTSTRCKPTGFGRFDERVVKTPRRGFSGLVARMELQDVAFCLVEPS